MALIRGHHFFDDHFAQIPNEWLRDSRLSLKAIGLLAQLMSHTVGWNLSVRSLARQNKTGLGTIKSAIEELEKFGYLKRSEKQGHKDDGTFAQYDWITQDPFQNTDTVKPRHGEIEHKEEQVIKKTIVKEPRDTASQISSSYQPNESLKAWAKATHPQTDIDQETEKFVDYWLGIGGARGRKLDWDATWRNWIRNSNKYSKSKSTSKDDFNDWLKKMEALENEAK